jgi:outer membrane protein
MKNLSLIVNGVLAVAVAVLFVLHFKGAKTVKPTSTLGTTGAPGSVIAYVDLDSLGKNYIYYKDKKADLEKEQKNLESILASGAESLQRDYYALQQKAQTMTQVEGEAAQQALMEKKNRLDQERESGSQNLQNESVQMNIEVYSKIDSALQEYTKEHKLAYVLSYQKGGEILYRDKGLDVTADVVELLNKLTPPKKK